MTRIAIVGAQSTGKTTLLDDIYNKYGSSINIFKETTRTVKKRGFEINENGDEDTQAAILDLHLENLKKSETGVNVFDRCILDWYVYTHYLHEIGKVSYEYDQYARDVLKKHMPLYDIIFYLRPLSGIADDGVRSTSIEYRDRIVTIFEQTILREKLDVICLPSDRNVRVNVISKRIDELL